MKTLKEFMNENEVTAFEVIDNLLISAVVGETSYALDVDTSNIPGGTLVTKVSDFSLNDDILTVGNITVDVNLINMMGHYDEN